MTEATKGKKWIYNSQKSPELATASIKRKWSNANVTYFDLCGADVALGFLRQKIRKRQDNVDNRPIRTQGGS